MHSNNLPITVESLMKTSVSKNKLIAKVTDGQTFANANVADMEYLETAFIKDSLILEVLIGGSDISRIIAEVSSKLTDANI